MYYNNLPAYMCSAVDRDGSRSVHRAFRPLDGDFGFLREKRISKFKLWEQNFRDLMCRKRQRRRTQVPYNSGEGRCSFPLIVQAFD